LEDSDRVAGGALITSTFLKKVNIALAKRGHIAIFISQVRDEIKINQYVKTLPRQGSASGGHSLEHYTDWVLDFRPRSQADYILETPSDANSKRIGHFAKVEILKSNNEKYGTKIRYPVKYGRTGGKSVWVEQEIVDMLLMWNLLTRKGAWYTVDGKLLAEINEEDDKRYRALTKEEDKKSYKNENPLAVSEMFQGMDNIRQWLEEHPKLTTYLFEKFRKLVTGA
jgi:hypothetical protein